jgi:hypothetical protein
MFNIRTNDEGISIAMSLTWREPIWSKLYQLVHYRYLWTFILSVIALIMFAFPVWEFSHTSNPSVIFYAFFSLIPAVGAMAHFAVMMDRTGKYRYELSKDWGEYLVVAAHLPHRWLGIWRKAAGGTDELSNLIKIALADKEKFNTSMRVITGVLKGVDRVSVARYFADDIRKYSRNVDDKLRSARASYRDYPAAWLMLFTAVPKKTVTQWVDQGTDMDDALRLLMKGTPIEVIGGAAGNDIDPSLLDSLIAGSDMVRLRAA